MNKSEIKICTKCKFDTHYSDELDFDHFKN